MNLNCRNQKFVNSVLKTYHINVMLISEIEKITIDTLIICYRYQQINMLEYRQNN